MNALLLGHVLFTSRPDVGRQLTVTETVVLCHNAVELGLITPEFIREDGHDVHVRGHRESMRTRIHKLAHDAARDYVAEHSAERGTNGE